MSFLDNQYSKKKGNLSDQIQVLDSCIDLKISNLNQASFDCFFLINNVMKQNRNNAIEAMNMVTELFELAGEKGNPIVIKKIKDQLSHFEENLKGLADEINNSLSALGIIKSNLQLLPDPFKNLAQNLGALNTLLTQIKLTNVYKDRSFKSFSGEEALKITEAINKLKNSCPVFEENVYNIENHIDSLYAELNKLKDFFTNDLLNDLSALSNELEEIDATTQYLLKKSKPVNQLLDDFNKQAAVVVEKIDYRNIIRTRLNHIQNTQKLMLQELFTNSDNNSHDTFENNDCDDVAKITSTQIDRLLYTHKEYRESVDRIISVMDQMGSKMHDMAETLAENNDANWYLSRHDRLTRLFDSLHESKQSQLKRYTQASNDMVLIYKIIKELFEKFKDLEMIENAIEQKVVDRINFGNLLISEEKETASLAQQILKAYADNHFEKNKIRTLFSNSIENLKEFIENKSVYLYGKKGIECINHIFENLGSHINDVCQNLNTFGNHILEVTEKSKLIQETGLESFEKFRIYDFSQKDINELIGQLEEINMLVKTQKPTMLPEKNNSNRKKELQRVFIPAKFT